MFLLSLLALAAPIDDTAHECRIERSIPRSGRLMVGQVFPQDDQGDASVYHIWKYRRGQIGAQIIWRSPALGPPRDDSEINVTLHDLPKGVFAATLELRQGGKPVPSAHGHAIQLTGMGYRDIYMSVPFGLLRQAAASGAPLTLVAIDDGGEVVDQVAMPATLLDQPGLAANALRSDFDALIADPAKNCPRYEPTTEIVVT